MPVMWHGVKTSSGAKMVAVHSPSGQCRDVTFSYAMM